MDRIRDLDRYQKLILLLLAVMLVTFGIAYCFASTQIGFLYQDEILIPSQVDGSTVYRGEIDNRDAEFTVTGDTVIFRHGEKVYGPYTVTEDPSAVPGDDPRAGQMTGLVIRNGGEILFRGGCIYSGEGKSRFTLYNEQGWYPGLMITATMSDGTVVDGDGNIVDMMEPSIGTVLNLINGPELISKASWLGWFSGAVISLMLAVSILFADELFRWKFMFRVRDPEQIEPSDWVLAERYIGWMVGVIGTLLIYGMGLK